MKQTIAVLLLLLGLTACVVEPGGDYREHAWNNGDHGDHGDHGNQADHGNWNR